MQHPLSSCSMPPVTIDPCKFPHHSVNSPLIPSGEDSMRVTHLMRQTLFQVLCFVVSVVMLGTAPGMVHAETREECITRVRISTTAT